jgi:hypothetical protein
MLINHFKFREDIQVGLGFRFSRSVSKRDGTRPDRGRRPRAALDAAAGSPGTGLAPGVGGAGVRPPDPGLHPRCGRRPLLRAWLGRGRRHLALLWALTLPRPPRCSPLPQSYNLGGMGCSNGVVSVGLVKDLLQVGFLNGFESRVGLCAEPGAPLNGARGRSTWCGLRFDANARGRAASAGPPLESSTSRARAHALPARLARPRLPRRAPARRAPTASRCLCPRRSRRTATTSARIRSTTSRRPSSAWAAPPL